MSINFNFSKLPWHTQLGAFLVLALAGVGAFWNFYAADAQKSLDARNAELAGLRAEVERGLATARRLPEFRKEVAQLEAQLDRLKAVLPEERDVADLLRRVQAMATQSNLTIRGFEPQAVANRDLHAEWPIGLKLEGNYHDLGSFLERVSKFPRIINVGGIKIEAKENPTGGHTITAECTATTFVLLDKGKPAVAPGAAPKAAQASMTSAGKEASL
jgi:type IV pilus assembly protein PilO